MSPSAWKRWHQRTHPQLGLGRSKRGDQVQRRRNRFNRTRAIPGPFHRFTPSSPPPTRSQRSTFFSSLFPPAPIKIRSAHATRKKVPPIVTGEYTRIHEARNGRIYRADLATPTPTLHPAPAAHGALVHVQYPIASR